jgi:protein-disulfide isomerase
MITAARFAPFVAVAVLLGCSRSDPPAVPAATNPAPPAAPAPAAQPGPQLITLDAALAGRLVRPHSPVIGRADAPVTLVEFFDPACEACRQFAPIVHEILFKHPDHVRLVLRYAPFHQGSEEAIRILEAAKRQKKFEAVFRALFDWQDQWASHTAPNTERAWQIAAEAGLDLARARRDARRPEVTQAIEQDVQDITAIKVESTPTFFVNGKRPAEFAVNPLLALIDAEVARVSQSRPAR